MEFSGKIVKWDEKKQFGFIFSEQTQKNHYFHISSFSSILRRPAVNLEVLFEEEHGRDCVLTVIVMGEKIFNFSAIIAFLISFCFLSGITYLASLNYFPIWIPCIYVAVSALTFIVYDFDKSRAGEDKSRVPEAVLHKLSFFCGWPGALFAQYSLRHKISKTPFILGFWITVLLNLSLFLLLLPPIKFPALTIDSLFGLEETSPMLISEVFSSPQLYDNRSVNLSGSIFDYEERISKVRNPYTVFTLRDNSGAIVIHYRGHLNLNPHKNVSVTGVFRQTTQYPENTFYNQVEASIAKQLLD